MSLINEKSTTKEILSEIRYTFMEKEFEEYQGIVVRREEDLKTGLKKLKEDYGLLKEEHELLERNHCTSELDKLELEEELKKIKIEFDSLKKKRFSSESKKTEHDLLKERLDLLERNHCSSVLEKLELEEELKKIKIELDSLKKKRTSSESETCYYAADQISKKPKIETDHEEAVNIELRKENKKLKEEIELYRKKFPEHVNRMACIEEMLADFKEKNASNFQAENVVDDPDDSISSQIRNPAEIQSSNLQKEGGETMHMGSRENAPNTGFNLHNSASDLEEPLTEAIFTQSAVINVEVVNTAAVGQAETPIIIVKSDSSDIDSDDDVSITDSFMDEIVRKR